MKMIENIRIALRALAANKLRAALTMLGIMIGVAAVITLLSIGDGVTRFVADQFVGLGSNLVFVLPSEDPDRPESTLTVRDAELLSDPALVPDAVSVAPVLFVNVDLQYAGSVYANQLRASTPSLLPMRGYEIERGRAIDENDYVSRSRVIVLGADVVESLYPSTVDPLGTSIKVNGITFEVVGLLKAKGAGLFGSEDDLSIAPLTTVQDRLANRRSQRTGEPLLDLILIQALDSSGVDNVVVDTADVLRQSHELDFRGEDDFQILTQQDFLSAFSQVTGVLTLFLGAIASISLLVGGIGIMNIMLVSVTERTREIGLRKAVGARYGDILGQFLTEAVVLSILGGLCGIGLGFLGSTGIHLLVPDLDTSVTAASVAMAVGFSVMVGLFFGIYPASRAAALHPIDALRFE